MDNNCDVPSFCGPNAICSKGICSCPTEDFEFVDPSDLRFGSTRIETPKVCNNCSSNPNKVVLVGAVDWPFNDSDHQNPASRITAEDCYYFIVLEFGSLRGRRHHSCGFGHSEID